MYGFKTSTVPALPLKLALKVWLCVAPLPVTSTKLPAVILVNPEDVTYPAPFVNWLLLLITVLLFVIVTVPSAVVSQVIPDPAAKNKSSFSVIVVAVVSVVAWVVLLV